nr:ABC transporter permease subunit [Nocardioides panacis]
MRSELRKITSTRLWWGLLVGAVVYTVIQAAANAALAGSDPGAGQPATAALDTAEAIRTIYASSPFQGSYIFAMILGITGMTGEYRYQTITPTFLATPRRARVVLGKMAAHLVVGVGYGVVCVLFALLVGGVVIAIRGYPLGYGADRLWSSVLLAVLAVGLWTMLGIGIGTLIRNQVAAVLVAVFVTFLVEPLATFVLAANDLDAIVEVAADQRLDGADVPGEHVRGVPPLVGRRPGPARLRGGPGRGGRPAVGAPRHHLSRVVRR